MEVIRRGVPPSEKIWRGTCSSCKSVVEAKRREIKVFHDQRDGDYAQAACPVCGASINFYEVSR